MTSSDNDITHMRKEECILKCPGRGHNPTGRARFSSGISAVGLVLPACPVHLIAEGLGKASLSVFLAVSQGAWQLVGLSKYLWNTFLPAPCLLLVAHKENNKMSRF